MIGFYVSWTFRGIRDLTLLSDDIQGTLILSDSFLVIFYISLRVLVQRLQFCLFMLQPE